MSSALPKRLIEVDLPIKRISAHASREKSIRHGHISTSHIWWARRPLAACRALICAALWPDPADPECPDPFRQTARHWIQKWVASNLNLLSGESLDRFIAFQKQPSLLDDNEQLRNALLDFIADFSDWNNSTVSQFLETSRALTQSAHECLGGTSGTKPLVFDPFAGGGSIPLEALRVGADAFASDLNPVAVVLNKVMLEYIPKYGQRLADEVKRWGSWIQDEAENELAEFYPKDPDGATPVAYLWARTIRCEGPNCGAEVPVITKTLLAQRKGSNVVLTYKVDKQHKSVSFAVKEQAKSARIEEGTVRRSAVSCPICEYTTPAANVRNQFIGRKGGTADARLLAVVTSLNSMQKVYRPPTQADEAAIKRAKGRLASIEESEPGVPPIPQETLPYLRSIFNINLLGVTEWGHLFTPRQALHIATFVKLIRKKSQESGHDELSIPTATCMGIVLDKMVDFHTSLTRWIQIGEKIGNTFGRQALGIIWDFAEANPFADISGSWRRCLEYLAEVIERESILPQAGQVEQASATKSPLPDDSAALFITDPPYYDLVPYADLSDFFYVWLKRTIGHLHRPLFDAPLSPKQQEIVQLAERNPAYAYKTRQNFEDLMGVALGQSRRVLKPTGIGIVFFAHKGTAAWETQLQAMINAGWIIVGSWPLTTERGGRLRAMDSAVLASSIQLICRPRENAEGSTRTDEVGDWRDVLHELPRRINDWMPRLAKEGVVGADAIFACIGPALEVFSRYSRVEKANGDQVALGEYLTYVWAAVAKEALAMVFKGADASGFEEDARVTAIWLWTLFAGEPDNGDSAPEEKSDEESEPTINIPKGYVLEYDAARKIAQGLGANLESLTSLVEIKGEVARLLPVAERTRKLFGNDGEEGRANTRKKKSPQLQLGFVSELEEAEEAGSWGSKGVPNQGDTVLDRVHQCMILFAASRGEALRRFLVDEGVGRDERFWRLAQVLSYLYPKSSDEKRWIDGVLARKKGLGF